MLDTLMRILVCGGRDFQDKDAVFSVLDRALDRYGIDDLLIIEGEARGADRLAREWAIDREVCFVGEPARWKRDGRKTAGPMRNIRMLDRWRPHGVIAFPGGPGTAHCIEEARRRGIIVWEPLRKSENTTQVGTSETEPEKAI